MTQPLTNTQRVGNFLLRAPHPVYLQEIIKGTKMNKNQVANVLTAFMGADIIEGLGTTGRARRFIVRNRQELQNRVDNPNRHGGGAVSGRKPDFGPLIAAMGQP